MKIICGVGTVRLHDTAKKVTQKMAQPQRTGLALQTKIFLRRTKSVAAKNAPRFTTNSTCADSDDPRDLFGMLLRAE